MDKRYLVDQLIEQLRAAARVAMHAQEDAHAELARGALTKAALTKAQGERARKTQAEADALLTFRPAPVRDGAPIALGALVEVEDCETSEGRTFFLAPAGAGITLTAPGGDGFFSVVTPASPLGRAVLGKRTGDVVDVTIDGAPREYTITWAG